jgi:hypothetical protein
MFICMPIAKKKVFRIYFREEMYEIFPSQNIKISSTKRRCIKEKFRLILIPFKFVELNSQWIIPLRLSTTNRNKIARIVGHPWKNTTFRSKEGGGRPIDKEGKGGGRDIVHNPNDKGVSKSQVKQQVV